MCIVHMPCKVHWELNHIQICLKHDLIHLSNAFFLIACADPVSEQFCASTIASECGHRRRTETEAKAKVVAKVGGTTFIQFLAALTVLPQTI